MVANEKTPVSSFLFLFKKFDCFGDLIHQAGEGSPQECNPKSAKKLEKRMEPVSEATVGSFHVRGYRGNTPEHHMAHLFQMGATVLPELVQRWQSVPAR